MSIVTEALNRLQSDRLRLSRQPETSEPPPSITPATTAGVPPAGSPPAGSANGAVVNMLRYSFRTVGILAILGGIGWGAYLWGLSLGPEVSQLSPESSVPVLSAKAPVSDPPTGDQAASAVDSPDSSASPSKGASPASDRNGESDAAAVAPSQSTIPKPSQPAVPKEGEVEPSKTQIAMASAGVAPPTGEKSVPNAKSQATVQMSGKETVSPTAGSSLKKPEHKTEEVEKPSEPTQSSSKPPDATVNEEHGSVPDQMHASRQEQPKRKKAARGGQSRRVSVATRVAQAQHLIKKRRYSQAVTILTPLFRTPPDRWELWFWMGTAHLGLGNLAEADNAFMEGLARDTTIPHLWVQRALVGQQRGRYGEAIESLRQAEILAPELPEVQLNLAYSLETQGERKLAVEHYHIFLALTEGKPAYRTARKKVLDRVIRLEST